jgi:hypothetical protein
MLNRLTDERILRDVKIRHAGAFTLGARDGDAFSNRICGMLSESNIPLLRLNYEEASLEDVFMEVIK